MYRIKQNKRVLESADVIVKGLSKCIKTTAFERINVCEIAAASGVSRATFYRLFDTPTDVLSYMCDKLAEETVNLYREEYRRHNAEMFGVSALKHWCSRTDVIETIFRAGCSNILQKSFENYSSFFHNQPDGISEREFDYMRTTFIGIICSILVVWTRHGRQESPEELMEIYKKIGKTVRKMRIDQIKNSSKK